MFRKLIDLQMCSRNARTGCDAFRKFEKCPLKFLTTKLADVKLIFKSYRSTIYLVGLVRFTCSKMIRFKAS